MHWIKMAPFVNTVLGMTAFLVTVQASSPPVWNQPGTTNGRPPPPPPPPAAGPWNAYTNANQEETEESQEQVPDGSAPRRPIHYNFPASDIGDRSRKDTGNAYDDYELDRDRNRNNDDDPWNDENPKPRQPRYASARRDPVARVQSTLQGRLSLACTAAALGAGFTRAFVSFVPLPVGAVFLALSSLLAKGKWGDLVRSLALAVWWTLSRSRHVKQVYPTWPHVKACIGAGPRQPFPDTNESLWVYVSPPDQRQDFRMLYVVAAATLTGGMCGGSLPLLPSWMGGLAGAACGGLAVLPLNARGDLARAMAMRVVGLTTSLLKMARELRLLPQVWTVVSALLDRLLILDRQHKVKDRIVAATTLVYQQVRSVVQQQQQQQQSDTDDRPRQRRRPRPRRSERDEDFEREDDRRPRGSDDRRPRGNAVSDDRRGEFGDGRRREDDSSTPRRKEQDRRPDRRDGGEWR